MNKNNWLLPWTTFLAELIGTALLVLVGLSIVILDFGQGSPIVHLLPSAGLRRLITGFLFGSTGHWEKRAEHISIRLSHSVSGYWANYEAAMRWAMCWHSYWELS